MVCLEPSGNMEAHAGPCLLKSSLMMALVQLHLNSGEGGVCITAIRPQRAQYPLIEECTLSHNKDPYITKGILLN